MTSQNRPNYFRIKDQIKQFVDHTKDAVNSLKQDSSSLDEAKIQQLAENIYAIEEESDQIIHSADEELSIEMQLIQNVIHQPIYPSQFSKERRTSISHAAKYCKESNNAQELREILEACVKNPESTKTLISDLTDVYYTLDNHNHE